MEIALALLGLVGVLIAAELWPKLRMRRAFQGRTPLTAEEFYAQYFRFLGVSPGVAIGVREALSEALDSDLSRIADEDDFSKNISFFYAMDSLADVNLVTALEEQFGIEISDVEWSKVGTVKEIVLMVDQKVKSKAA